MVIYKGYWSRNSKRCREFSIPFFCAVVLLQGLALEPLNAAQPACTAMRQERALAAGDDLMRLAERGIIIEGSEAPLSQGAMVRNGWSDGEKLVSSGGVLKPGFGLVPAWKEGRNDSVFLRFLVDLRQRVPQLLASGDRESPIRGMQPERAALRFSLGLRDGFDWVNGWHDGVSLTVFGRRGSEGIREPLLQREVTEQRWQEVEVDLSGYVGEIGQIELIVDPGQNPRSDHFLWGEPVIETESCARDSWEEVREITPKAARVDVPNPGRGWIINYYDNATYRFGRSDLRWKPAPGSPVELHTPKYRRIDLKKPFSFPGAGMVQFRLSWHHFEPHEGDYRWGGVDPARNYSPLHIKELVQYFKSQGLEVGFSFSTSENAERWATPPWVGRAGATFFDMVAPNYCGGYRRGALVPGKERCHEPDFGDPIYLNKLEKFLRAFAEEFKDEAALTLVDVGTFGVWGEGHTFQTTKRTYPYEVALEHLAMHRRVFGDRVQLAVNDDMALQAWIEECTAIRGAQGNSAQGNSTRCPRNPVLQHALEQGFALRDSSVFARRELGDSATDLISLAGRETELWAAEFGARRPVIVETALYDLAKARGTWNSRTLTHLVLNRYQASYVLAHWFPYDFLLREKELVRELALSMGYRFHVPRVRVPQGVRAGESLRVEVDWQNRGVAPIYTNFAVGFALRDSQGVVTPLGNDAYYDIRTWLPSRLAIYSTQHERILPPEIAAGKYQLLLALVSTQSGKPAIALALAERDSQRWHSLGTLEVH